VKKMVCNLFLLLHSKLDTPGSDGEESLFVPHTGPYIPIFASNYSLICLYPCISATEFLHLHPMGSCTLVLTGSTHFVWNGQLL
jgi:hypothetical protein